MSPGLMISFTISSMQLWKCFKRHSVTIQCYNYVFFSSAFTLLQCIVKTAPISIRQLFRTGNHMFHRRIAQNRGRSMSIFFYLPQPLLLRSLFSFER